MNRELLHRLIEQAAGNESLQQALLRDPDTTLAQWGFTAQEVAWLKTMLEQGTPLEELDARVSKYIFGGGGSPSLP